MDKDKDKRKRSLQIEISTKLWKMNYVYSKLFIYRKIKYPSFVSENNFVNSFIKLTSRSGLFSFSLTNFDLDIEYCFLKVSVPVINRLVQDKDAFSLPFYKTCPANLCF